MDASSALDAGSSRDASASDASGSDAQTTHPDPECAEDGCLRAASKVGDFGRSFLEPYLEPGVRIENGYSVWTLEYVTDGATSLATVTLPFAVDAPADGWAIVANDHGTSGVGDVCKLSGTVAGAGLAGLFGARGMIGVATDYPGLGTPGVHPYLVSTVEGRATLDALRAARNLAVWLRLPVSGRYAVVGLSQGGHAALAAAAEHASYAPELDIRAFGASAPASVWEEQWRAGVMVDGPHLAFHALLVYAWAAHYGFSGPSLWADGLSGRIDSIMDSECVVPIPGAPTTLMADLGERADAIFSAPFLRAYGSGDWGDFADFHSWFTLNRIGPYEQTAPLRIYQGDADTIVLEPGTRALVDDLRAGGVEVDYQVVPGGEHTTVAFGFVASDELRTEESIAWIRGLVEAP
ncbi:MAG: hypothetical protein GXP55_05505 [Deltaproteobacteria bacterium]|nr:hypothetical protein [Deltaproteobacteria bacterium]